MTIKEAYEKYKHLDHLLSNFKEDDFVSQILYNLWEAIKIDVASRMMLIHKENK